MYPFDVPADTTTPLEATREPGLIAGVEIALLYSTR